MQIIGGPGSNSTNADPSQGPGSFPTGVAARGGVVILHNLSPYELQIVFNNDQTRTAIMFAWQQRKFDFCGRQTDTISYQVLFQQQDTTSAPSSVIFGEAFTPGEPVPESLPNYDRLSNVGNTVTTAGSSQSLNNTGNPPGTAVYSVQPNDQSVDAEVEYNDGSGSRSILSAGSQRSIWSFTRGSATAHAVCVFGDTNDKTAFTFYGVFHGTADAANSVPASGVTGTLPASQVGAGYPYSSLSGAPAGGSYLPLAGGDMNTNAHITFHLDTTSANQEIDGFLDAHSGAHWQRYIDQSGNYTLWDAVNSRNGYVFKKADGHVQLGPIEFNQTTNEIIGHGLNGDNDFDVQCLDTNFCVITNSSNSFFVKYNNKFNGTNDVFIDAQNAYQVTFGSLGPTIHWNTNTPVAGQPITWGPFYPLLAGAYQSGAPSFTNFPSGSAIWVNSSY